MKKLIIALLAIMALPVLAGAVPFLVCDPPSVTLTTGQTITYNITGLPTNMATSNVPSDSTGTYGFALDCAALSGGTYTVTAILPASTIHSARTGVQYGKRPFLVYENITASGSIFPGAFSKAIMNWSVEKK